MGGAGFVHDPVFGVGTFLRPSTFGSGHQSLEEVEAQLLRTARGQPQRLSMQQHAQGDRKMMSLEEVEAALMNINGGRPVYSEAMLAEQQAKIALLEKRRAAREAKQAETVSENAEDIFLWNICHLYRSNRSVQDLTILSQIFFNIGSMLGQAQRSDDSGR